MMMRQMMMMLLLVMVCSACATTHRPEWTNLNGKHDAHYVGGYTYIDYEGKTSARGGVLHVQIVAHAKVMVLSYGEGLDADQWLRKYKWVDNAINRCERKLFRSLEMSPERISCSKDYSPRPRGAYSQRDAVCTTASGKPWAYRLSVWAAEENMISCRVVYDPGNPLDRYIK